MNEQQRRAVHGLVDAALCFDPLHEISISIQPGRPDQEHLFYFHIKGRWRERFDTGRVETQEHGNHYGLHYDQMRAVLTDARSKVSREQEKCHRSRPSTTALQRAIEEWKPPYAFWQPVWVPVHAPKDNQTLCTLEHCLRQILKGFDPCKPIELVRDGIHYSAKKAPPPHLFIRGKPLEARDPEATLCYDPICRQDITHIDDYEEAYDIVEEVLAEFRRVGLVAALCHGAKALDYQAFLKTLPKGG